MARCQVDKLDAPTAKKGISRNKEGVGWLMLDGVKRGVDLAARTSIENPDLQPDGASSRRSVSQCGFCTCIIVRIDEHSNSSRSRHQLMQKVQSFSRYFRREKIDTCERCPRGARGWPQDQA